jgi:hypothetical protein
MALKFKFKSQEDIPADQAGLYVERDGMWVLDVDGAVEKAKLDEFRNTNVSLAKERDELKKRFEGIDPDEFRRLAEEKRKLEEEQQVKAGEADKVAETRIKNAKAEWDKQLAALTTERDTLHSRLTSIQIDQAVVTEATRRGLRPTAIPDITARARNTFRLVNGVPQAFEADGQAVRVGRDGYTPMTVAEWIDAQASEAPHLFESNAGGGAGSGGGGNGSGGVGNRASMKNPFRKETWNLTEQMKLMKTDPSLAARLKAAA